MRCSDRRCGREESKTRDAREEKQRRTWCRARTMVLVRWATLITAKLEVFCPATSKRTLSPLTDTLVVGAFCGFWRTRSALKS